MKNFIFCLTLIAAFTNTFSQNVGVGTTAPQAKLHVKGSADTSQLVIDASATQTNARPLIRLRDASGMDLMHINSDAQFNVFMGFGAGRTNRVSITDQFGLYNTFLGSNAGFYNLDGSFNTAIGRSSLYQNTWASYNTAVGFKSLFSNTIGEYNVAVGMESMVFNILGDFNSALGAYSLRSNTSGIGNTAIGYGSLEKQSFYNGGSAWSSLNTAVGFRSLTSNNPTSTSNGIDNTAVGSLALTNNTTGSKNSAFGKDALLNCTFGAFNTAVGALSNVDLPGNNYNTLIGVSAHASGSGNVLIGYNAYSSTHYIAQLGNPTTTACGGYTNWTNYASDKRIKTSVHEDVKGLDFILRLRPVTYNLDVKAIYNLWGISPYSLGKEEMTGVVRTDMDDAIQRKESVRTSGFIAQEVEAAAMQSGYDFDGIKKPQNDKDHYGLSYSSFVMPLVKAIQEQQKMIATLSEENTRYKNEVDEMKLRIEKLEKMMMEVSKR